MSNKNFDTVTRPRDTGSRKKISGGDTDTVSWYLNEIQKHPTLDHTSSVAMFQEFQNAQDENTKQRVKKKLVNSNLRLVVSVAKGYIRKDIPMEDLIQEGNIGLMKAVDRYDWTKGFRFSTYATWWIRQSISQHVLKRRKTIRLPAHAVGLQRRMISAVDDYKAEFGNEPSTEELSAILGTSERIVKATMQSGRQTISLSTPLNADDQNGDTLGDTIADTNIVANPFDAVAESELIIIVRDVLNNLSAKEAAILRLRFGISEDVTDHVNFPVTEQELEDIALSGKGLQDNKQ